MTSPPDTSSPIYRRYEVDILDLYRNVYKRNWMDPSEMIPDVHVPQRGTVHPVKVSKHSGTYSISTSYLRIVTKVCP